MGTRVTVAHMCHQAPSWGQSLDSSDLGDETWRAAGEKRRAPGPLRLGR